MNHTQLKERLMSDARCGGICAEGYGLMRGYDRDELIAYYLKCPDWCMERGFPSLDILRSEFSDCEDKGVYVGKTFDGEVFSDKQVYIFHDCKGTIKVAMDYDNAVIPMLYFANGCRMRVTCTQKENLKSPIDVPLYIFGKNDIQARSNIYAKFIKHKHGLL